MLLIFAAADDGFSRDRRNGRRDLRDWLVPKLDLLKSTPLPAQNVVKPMQVSHRRRGGHRPRCRPASRVRIRSVPADSDEAKRWSSGQLPVPVLGGLSPGAG